MNRARTMAQAAESGAPRPDPVRLQALEAALRQARRIPSATYRLQLHGGQTFRDAAKLVPYLAELGISECYTSPYLAARPGSQHGYDICDHTKLNAELGSEGDYEAFIRQLAAQGMGHILDFVPNHMGIDPRTNRWWNDVLENGACSPYARFFDIDWDSIKLELKGKILLPILGGQYGVVLERGELRLHVVEGGLELSYGEQRLPVSPRDSVKVFRHGLEALQQRLKEDDPALREYLSIITALSKLPPSTETDPERIAERQREKQVARERLQHLMEASVLIREHIDQAIRVFNGEPGRPESFDLLHELLEDQTYRLAYWRTAADEVNYRRFFDINMLAGLHMEDPAVFAATHALVLRLIRERKVTGLRLDHPDGLFDPAAYFERLQQAIFRERASAALGGEGPLPEDAMQSLEEWRSAEARRDPAAPAARPLYAIAEKILSAGEQLPETWAIFGTTGYEFLNDLNGLFVESANAQAMRRLYEQFIGRSILFTDVVYESKKLIMATSMASELNVLADALNRLSEGDRRSRDFTLNSLRDAIREVVACFPVYRTYITGPEIAPSDRQMIESAIARAKRRNPAMEVSIFNFLRDVLLQERSGQLPETERRRRLEFAMKFQQYTSPVMAKGFEDTAYYRYNLLVSLNEVGGDPQRFGRSVEAFHELNLRRAQRWPRGILATMTHDSKRSEDVRARLNVLSELPEEWSAQVSHWSRLNAECRTLIDGEWAPERNDEYLFYQTLVGAWPLDPEAPDQAFIDRIVDYMLKAVKEAKVHTSWINDRQVYDEAVAKYAQRALGGPEAGPFLAVFRPFQRRVAELGMVNALAQVLVKVASPGVPDFYQGSELWDFSLVDPDNRRPVDFARRARLLEAIAGQGDQAPEQLARELIARREDGRIKLFVMRQALRLRRAYQELFVEGDYVPLQVTGLRSRQVVAFARRRSGDWAMAVVPRLLAASVDEQGSWPQPGFWGDTAVQLPLDAPQGWRDALILKERRAMERREGPALRLAEALDGLPIALLEGTP